ncbi:class I SAM-dependent methyltransferase [Paraliomyxa miuraensis]|uniref:class I SAM-dependent methyltransferase n=1 Tax=Paraliomyxa miuraensis TaxID=376150 RepID=UPI002254297A|nr:methyltransferase domain-containing protein [Paraliomyxa miuraensis]MCX4245852.1 methyltransferase domain-containing protein [Paraliomyxa miuraensis]
MSRSTKGPSRTGGKAPLILAPVGLPDQPALLPTRESDRLTALVDRLTADVVLRHATGRRVLDLGRGSPEVTDWVGPRVDHLSVVDAVDLGRGAAIGLPLPDASFDCVYSLRTLPHLGHDARSSQTALESALTEVGRVLTPGGVAVLGLDNARSPIGLFHGLRHLARRQSSTSLVVDSPRGLTRFDVLSRVTERLPPTLTPVDLHGVRVVVASPHLLAVPLLGRLLAGLEWRARDQPVIRRLAAHLLMVLRRPMPPHRPNPGSGPQLGSGSGSGSGPGPAPFPRSAPRQ